MKCSSGLETSVPGHLRRGRHLRVRQPRPRPPPARGALGRGRQPGQDRRAQHARPRRRARGGPLLLLRPRRLGVDGVRGPGSRASPWCAARWTRASSPRLLARRRPRDGRADRRALRRPGARAPLHEGTERRASRSPSPTSPPTSSAALGRCGHVGQDPVRHRGGARDRVAVRDRRQRGARDPAGELGHASVARSRPMRTASLTTSGSTDQSTSNALAGAWRSRPARQAEAGGVADDRPLVGQRVVAPDRDLERRSAPARPAARSPRAPPPARRCARTRASAAPRRGRSSPAGTSPRARRGCRGPSTRPRSRARPPRAAASGWVGGGGRGAAAQARVDRVSGSAAGAE